MPIKKILVLRFSSIGDIVLTTPVIRNIKNQVAGAEIHYCTKAGYKILLEENPFVDRIFTLESDLGSLIKLLKNEKYDLIIDLHNNIRTRLIAMKLGVKAFRFDKLNIKKWLLVNLKIDRLPNRHIVDRYMDTTKSLGVINDKQGLDYFIPHKDEVEITWLPETHQKEYVAVVIGAKLATKKLPLKRLIELCDKINQPIILLGGPEDAEDAEQIVQFFAKNEQSKPYEEKLKELGKRTEIFNACGKFNLNQSASIIKNAKVVFSHDTGLMHIAAAFKKTVFSIWGNTTSKFGMYPYETKFTVFENNKINCRPCSKIGYHKCPKGHFKCMNDIVFDFYIP